MAIAPCQEQELQTKSKDPSKGGASMIEHKITAVLGVFGIALSVGLFFAHL